MATGSVTSGCDPSRLAILWRGLWGVNINWFPSINAVISLAKAQSTLRQAIYMLLKQLLNTLRALRLCENQLFMDRH
jgi:hypothetical protein